MSTINNVGASSPYTSAPAGRRDGQKQASESPSAKRADGDSLEISDAAKNRIQDETVAIEEDGGESLGSLLQPEKTLTIGSEEHKKFRELMDAVKTQKSDISSRIDAVLKERGLSRSGLGKMKIEVDASGKILVGGLKDKNAAKAIEDALNQDDGLGAAIKEYQQSERELSKRIKDYTGCSLYELTMTSRGDINARIREAVEGDQHDLGVDYYMNLGFLGSTLEFVTQDDIAALSFGDGVDFSAELDLMADPEGNIRQAMDDVYKSIQSAFDELNREYAETLRQKGVTGDAMAGYLLNAAGAAITIDSDGNIDVSGVLSRDPEMNKKGLNAIRDVVRNMLAETESNSYHVNVFLAASQNLANREAAASGQTSASHSKVVVEMSGGRVNDIRSETVTPASRSHANAKRSIQRAMIDVLR